MGNDQSQENQEEEVVEHEVEFDWAEGPQVEDKRHAEMWLQYTKDKIDAYEAERSRSIKTPDTATAGQTSEVDRKLLAYFYNMFITALF